MYTWCFSAQVCEYAIALFSGVALGVRGGLLAAWVRCKQLLQQSISSKSFGLEGEVNHPQPLGATTLSSSTSLPSQLPSLCFQEAHDPLLPHCRAIVAVEMVDCHGNRLWEFVGAPTLPEVVSMVMGCEWTEKRVEMELWTRVAGITFKQHEYETVSMGMRHILLCGCVSCVGVSVCCRCCSVLDRPWPWTRGQPGAPPQTAVSRQTSTCSELGQLRVCCTCDLHNM